MKIKVIFLAMVLVVSAFRGIVYGADEGPYHTLFGSSAGASTPWNALNSLTAVGRLAGEANTAEGYDNSFFGDWTGSHNTTGDFNTFVGAEAGQWNTIGDSNVFLGYKAGNLNDIGNENTFVGDSAGFSNTSGYDNVFVGIRSGYSNKEGYGNTFLGPAAGYSNTSGGDNTFVGYGAGNSNTTGGVNTFVGYLSGNSNNGGYDNTYLGAAAGSSNTNGSRNVFLGYGAGSNNTGDNNVFIGYRAGLNATGSNNLYIDNSDTTTPLIYGEFNNNIVTIYGKLGIATKTPTQKIDLGGGALTLNGSDNTGAMPPGMANWEAGRIDFGYGGNGGGNLEAYSKAPPNYSSPTDDRRGEFRFVYGGGPTMGKVRYVHYDGTAWSTKMWLTYDGQLQMTPDGYTVSAYTDGYQWVDASSRAYKENIRDLSVDEAMDTLKELSPVRFNYKSGSKETHVGFIAEDVPALVATSDRKGMSPMDVVAVLTKVVQELKAENEAMKQRLLMLETKGSSK